MCTERINVARVHDQSATLSDRRPRPSFLSFLFFAVARRRQVLRAILGVAERFVPWQSNHWSTGAYLINRRGMEKIV